MMKLPHGIAHRPRFAISTLTQQTEGANHGERTQPQETARRVPLAHPPDSRKFRDRQMGLRPSGCAAAIEFRDLSPGFGAPGRAGIRGVRDAGIAPRADLYLRPAGRTEPWNAGRESRRVLRG